MRRALIWAVSTALAVGVLGAIAPAASGDTPDTTSHQDSGNITSATAASTTAAQQQSVVDYWTPERMAAAQPIDVSAKAIPLDQQVPESAPAGKPGKTSGAAGTLRATAPLAGTSTADPVGRPYTSLPNRLNGKVFFSENGGNYVCSGTLVNSNNKDMVDTAGHCVATGSGAWVTNWAFVPAYSSSYYGQAPYGVWPARTLATRTEWFYYDNLKQDYGYGIVGVQYGTHIVNWLGGQGTLWNYPRNLLVYEFGYPQAYPYNGYDQRLNVSYTFGADYPSGRAGSATMEINSPQTGGTSGGGWLAYLGSNGLGYMDSHSSYRYGNTPNNLWGPYYGSDLQSLFAYAQTL